MSVVGFGMPTSFNHPATLPQHSSRPMGKEQREPRMKPESKNPGRRQILAALGLGLGGGVLAACNGTTTSPSATSTTDAGGTANSGTASGACASTANETEGPYPDRLGMVNNQAFFRRDV